MLKITNWTIKNFKQENIVLKDLNLVFNRGEVVAIIGASGIGKTTLLNSLAINAEILSGEIFLDNKKIDFKNRKTLKQFRKHIGYVSQKKSLVDDLSVFDNLKSMLSSKNNFFFNFLNIINKNQKTKIFDILLKLGILDKAFYKIRDLSGGESQRVEVAKVLITQPSIILADEPTSNLDIVNSSEVISLLCQIAKQNKAIVIINIHNLDQLNTNIDRVIALKDQKVYFDKSPIKISKKDLGELYGK